MRQFSFLFFVVVVLVSTVASAQGWNPEFRGKLEEEIRANDARAAELGPIIARNEHARDDCIRDFQQLSAEARGMRDRAHWFREGANRTMGRFREHLVHQADDLDKNAQRNEQLAATESNMRDQLNALIISLNELRTWHIETSRQLHASLEWR